MIDEVTSQHLNASNTQLALFFPLQNSNQTIECKVDHPYLKLSVPTIDGSNQNVELLFTNEAFELLKFAHKSVKVPIKILIDENVNLFNSQWQIFDDQNEPIQWDLIDKNLVEKRRKILEQLDMYKTYDNQHPFIHRLIISILLDYVKNHFSDKDEQLFIKAIEENDFLTYFIKAYTRPSRFFRILNKHLALYIFDCFDLCSYSSTTNYRLINSLGHIVTLIIHHPNIHEYKYQGTTYRGVSMSENNLRRYQINYHVLNRAFVSTSKDQEIAETFCKDTREQTNSKLRSVLFKYTIKQNRTAIDIANKSTIKHEEEVLILPFSLFRIIRRTDMNSSGLVEIELEECEDEKEEKEEMNSLELDQQPLTANQPIKRTKMKSKCSYPIIIVIIISISIALVFLVNRFWIKTSQKPLLTVENSTVLLTYSSTLLTTTTTTTKKLIELLTYRPNLQPNTKWQSNALTVAKSMEEDKNFQIIELHAFSFEIEDDRTMIIADLLGHRVLEWKPGVPTGEVIAGGNGQGSRDDQLDAPTDLCIRKRTEQLIICDRGNRRIVQWPRRHGTSGEILMFNIHCFGITIDSEEFLYIVDVSNHEVRRWKIGDQDHILVAGGNGKGYQLNQLNNPHYIFLDNQKSIYISDHYNNRVVKWIKDDKEGIIVAGGHRSKKLSNPEGLYVDNWGTVYVSDCGHHRITRWINGSTSGESIAGSGKYGNRPNELNSPRDLAFDLDGNLYVADCDNYRIQMFSIDRNLK